MRRTVVMKPLLPVVVLVLASVLWGLTWLPLKYFGEHGILGPLVTLVGHGCVGLLALPLLWVKRHAWWRHRRRMLWIGLMGGLANVSFASAMVVGDVTRVMALFYLLPAWGVLGGRFLLGEQIDRQRWLSLVCALCGAFLVLGGPELWSVPPSFVDLLAIVSGLAFALNNVLFRGAVQVNVPIKVGVGFVGCLLWAAACMLMGGSEVPTAVRSSVWAGVAGFGLIWILVATVGTLWSVNQMEAGRSSVLIIMELVTAVLSVSVLTGRVPSGLELWGAALILLSALLEAWRPGDSVVTVAAPRADRLAER